MLGKEEKKVSLIFIENFPKNLRLAGNKLFLTFQVKKDEDAFNKLKENIEDNNLYNVILSGHKTVEDAYRLLKSFLEYNMRELYYIDNANYPFFMFIENEKFDKKKLYNYYINQEKNIENLQKEEYYEYCIDSKILIFSPNEMEGLKEKLNLPLNYYNRKDWKVKNNPYYSPNIRIMYVGVTGTGKSTLINQLNGKKLSYSSSDNQEKTKEKIKGNAILFKNPNYPILNQDTEGFEIADKSQLEKVNENINKNYGSLFNERVHIVIYLLKNENGLDNDDIALFAKLHKMNILYYALFPKKDGKDINFQGKAARLINSLIKQFKNNNLDDNIKNIFKEFLKEKDKLIQILEEIKEKTTKIIFSSNILSKKSEGKIKLLRQIKDDLLEKKRIHEKFIETIEKENLIQEKMKIGISGDVIKKEDNKNYYKMLDNSPFFCKYSIEEIKRKEAEELLNDCEISPLWLLFYNKKVENFRKELLEKIKAIYSDVKIGVELEEKIFDDKESWFYKTEFTKKFIIKLINFFEGKYKELELNGKYLSACRDYNSSITEFVKYVEEFTNTKLNEEPILYDIDLI